MGIRLETWEVDEVGSPEHTALETLRRNGARAHFLENSIGWESARLLLADRLEDWCRTNGKVSFEYIPIAYYPEFVLEIQPHLEEILSMVDETTWIRNSAISRHADPFRNQWDRGIFQELLDSFGFDTVKKFASMYMSNPLAYNVGWPDILVLDESPCFIEVKTKDRFHVSQIITIPDLMARTGVAVRCVRLQRSHRTRPRKADVSKGGSSGQR